MARKIRYGIKAQKRRTSWKKAVDTVLSWEPLEGPDISPEQKTKGDNVLAEIGWLLIEAEINRQKREQEKKNLNEDSEK